jgi:hypothetical protein
MRTPQTTCGMRLEERIAVGDPECRVIVWLGRDKRGGWGLAHEYAAETGRGGSGAPLVALGSRTNSHRLTMRRPVQPDSWPFALAVRREGG